MSLYSQYYFWLIAVSVLCFTLERLGPWRREQKVLRRGIWQDLFWLVFNGHFLGMALAWVGGHVILRLSGLASGLGAPDPGSAALLAGTPLWAQCLIFFILKDFIEWNIHRTLHAVPWLWELHKLHHSIEELDWIGNFRFHWGEVVVYKTLSYLPLVVLGVDARVILAIAVFGTLIQDLNHANLRLSWGPLRYVLNSPRMHVWHHDVELHGRHGQNYGIVLSVWDWLFATAYWPPERDQPAQLGFRGMDAYPHGLLRRFVYPVAKHAGQAHQARDKPPV